MVVVNVNQSPLCTSQPLQLPLMENSKRTVVLLQILFFFAVLRMSKFQAGGGPIPTEVRARIATKEALSILAQGWDLCHQNDEEMNQGLRMALHDLGSMRVRRALTMCKSLAKIILNENSPDTSPRTKQIDQTNISSNEVVSKEPIQELKVVRGEPTQEVVALSIQDIYEDPDQEVNFNPDQQIATDPRQVISGYIQPTDMQSKLQQCLTFTHLAIRTTDTPSFGAVLVPFLSGTPEVGEGETGVKVSCTCGAYPNPFWIKGPSTVHCNVCGHVSSDHIVKGLQWSDSNDIRMSKSKKSLTIRRIVVVLEVDEKGKVFNKLKKTVSQLAHQDIHLILYQPSWHAFLYHQINRNCDIDKIISESQSRATKVAMMWNLVLLFRKTTFLQSLEFASNLLKDHDGKIVIIKTTNTSFPDDARAWAEEACTHATIDILGCSNRLPESLQLRLVEEGGRFMGTTADDLDTLLKYAFGVGESEIYDVHLQFICSEEICFQSVEGHAMSDVKISDNGRHLSCNMKRLLIGEPVGVVLQPSYKHMYMGNISSIQAIVKCRGLDGQKSVIVANAQMKLSDDDSTLPQIGPLMVLEALKAKNHRYYINLWHNCLQEEYKSPLSETEEFHPALNWLGESPSPELEGQSPKPVTNEGQPTQLETQESQPSVPVTMESQFPVSMTQESQPPKPVT